MRPQAKFRVGDRVLIVSAKNCIYGCNEVMPSYIGCEGTVIARERDYDKYGYRLDVDDSRFLWCDKCLEAAAPQADIEESDESMSILLGG